MAKQDTLKLGFLNGWVLVTKNVAVLSTYAPSDQHTSELIVQNEYTPTFPSIWDHGFARHSTDTLANLNNSEVICLKHNLERFYQLIQKYKN